MDYLGGAIRVLCERLDSDADAALIAQLKPRPAEVFEQVRTMKLLL